MGAAIAVAAVSMGALGVWSATAGAALAPLPEFPNNLVLFPNRDFIAIEGFSEYGGQTATVEVHRNGEITGSAQSVVSGGDVAFEINHPGGVCWGAGTNLNVTPDMIAGDEVTISIGGQLVASTTVQGATVTGVGSYIDTVLDPTGRTMIVEGSIAAGFNTDNFEQRIIEPALRDTEIARRDIRALFGPPTPDANNSYVSGVELTSPTTWKATYVFQDASTAVIADAAGGERAMTWQFTDPAANRQGLTIAEFGEPGGPGFGGCPNGPLQSGPPAPTSIIANVVDSNHAIEVNWTPATAIPGTPAILGYRITAVGAPNGTEQLEIGRRITDPAATSTIITGFGSGGVAAADTFQVKVASFSSVGETFPAVTAIPVADTVAPVAASSLPSGSYPVEQLITLTSDDPSAEIYFTTDGSSPIETSGGESVGALNATLFTAPILVSASTTIKFAAIDLVGNASAVETLAIEITNELAASAPTITLATPGISDVAVSWDAALPMAAGSTLAGYDVRVYDAVDATSPVAHVETAGDVLSAVVAGLSSERNYWVAVAAKNSINPTYTESVRSAFTTLGVTANAGLDRLNISRPSTITLAGSGSVGATYAWSQVGDESGLTNALPGDNIVIGNATTLTPTITIPAYTLTQSVGPRYFKLTVTRNGASASDVVKVVPVIDPVGITTARWKANDFRIVGSGGIDGATVTVYRADNNVAIGTATVALGAWEVRLRNGAQFVPNVFAVSNRGGRTGSVAVTR
ncbi:MAG: chitobiase/beta-hexosaminidase C-terminal domain-containing protein [Actinobacteria bacterium]|nr:chitobiase/beta-hexosaminidase C-terminal domain-containing protein [Actinomycetota bacterium]